MRNILFFIVLGTTACATNPNTGSSAGDTGGAISTQENGTTLSLVADEFVTVLSKLDEFPVVSTTIQYSEPESRFSNDIISSLKTNGYGTQKVSADQGINYIEITRAPLNDASADKNEYRYSITVADITIGKTFKDNNDSLSAISELQIQGTDPQYIEHGSRIEFRDDQGNLRQYANNVSEASQLSNTEGYEPHKQLLIRFTSDTLDIGRDNKNAIRQLTENFNKSERFTVSACEQTKTIEWDGTNEIAEQRGNRVTQELLTLGIPVEHTHIESCSSQGYNLQLEQYSVLLTLETSKQRPTPNRARSGRARYGFF